MADSLFGLKDLSDNLNASISSSGGTSTDSDALATSMGTAVQSWLQGSIFPLIIGVVIFVTILAVFYGGFLYFTAYGDENKALAAKKSITFGFIGLFIALSAFTITSYVRQNLIKKEAERRIYENFSAPVTSEGAYDSGEDLLTK